MPTDPREVLRRPAPAPDATLAYGGHPDQVADVRLARSTDDPDGPPVVVIHGGFWRHAYDRTHTGPLAADLASHGYPVVQLEYRRTGAPGGGWPGTFEDVAAGLSAVPELLARAYRDRGRPPPVGPPILLGHSAGGQLALWAAADAPDRVGAVLALAPVADLGRAHRLNLGGGAVDALLGGAPDRFPDRYAAVDPARRLPLRTRVVILHGLLDRQVPAELSRQFTAAAEAAGDDCTLVELADCEHFGLIDPRSPAWPATLAGLRSLHG